MKKNLMKVSLLMALAFAFGANAEAGLADAPVQQKAGKSLEQLYEQYKSSMATNTQSVDGKVKQTAIVNKVPDTEYAEINELQNKLQNLDAYIADGRSNLSNATCASGATCSDYYKRLQVENRWYESTAKGYASKGCEPNRQAVLVSDSESVYYQSIDPMLGKDESKIIKLNPAMKSGLMQNKRVLAQNAYADDVCAKYAKDIWTTQNRSGYKLLKIKKQEF